MEIPDFVGAREPGKAHKRRVEGRTFSLSSSSGESDGESGDSDGVNPPKSTCQVMHAPMVVRVKYPAFMHRAVAHLVPPTGLCNCSTCLSPRASRPDAMHGERGILIICFLRGSHDTESQCSAGGGWSSKGWRWRGFKT